MNRRPLGSVSAVCVAILLSCCQFVLVGKAAAKDSQPSYPEAQDLRYGVILYHFYQQAYFDAITETMVGEKAGDMPVHQGAARLLRGGMSLSYGMSHQAEALFNELLAASDNDIQRDRAWFYLGKLYYQRGDRAAARRIFSQVGESLPEPLRQEYQYYLANLHLDDGDIDAANELIDTLPKDSPWLAYFYFNRGARQTLAGNWQQGVESFAAVSGLPLADEEGLTIQDRALMASGYARLGGGDAEAAIDDFIRVRLDSPLVDKALLGYGWAAVRQQDYRRALSPWQALSKRSMMHPSVLESLLAIPYAYEKLGAPASALDEYRHAVDVYEQEISHVDAAISVFVTVPIVDLVSDDEQLGGDWISGKDYLPINPQAPYLKELIARDHFQSAVKDLSDLVSIRDHLVDADRRIDALQVVLNDQQAFWEQNLDAADREQYQQRYLQLLALQQQLLAQQESADRESNGRRLISSEESQLWRIASHAEGLIGQLREAGQDVSGEASRLRILQGLLYWAASENDSERRWQFSKTLHQVEQLLAETRQRLQRLETLGNQRYDEQHAARLQDLRERLDQQLQQTQGLVAAAEQDIRELAVADLQSQRMRLFQYLGQAKLAIARLYDIGSEEHAR